MKVLIAIVVLNIMLNVHEMVRTTGEDPILVPWWAWTLLAVWVVVGAVLAGVAGAIKLFSD